MDASTAKSATTVKRLVRESKIALDTPALISLLAQDQALMQAVFRVLNPAPGMDDGLLEEFARACRQEHVTAEDLKRRLEPAAAALGLSRKSEDASVVLYDILDVPSGASDSDIRKAYRNKARELHPDANPDADPARFVRLTEAYRVLSNPALREEYDVRKRSELHWEERSRAFREEAYRNEDLKRRRKRRMAFQGIGALVFLLLTIVFVDLYFKEQSLLEPSPSKAPVPMPGDSGTENERRLLPAGENEKGPAPPLKSDQDESSQPAKPGAREVRIRPGIPDIAKRPLNSIPKEPAVIDTVPEEPGFTGEERHRERVAASEAEFDEVRGRLEAPETGEKRSAAALATKEPETTKTAPEPPGIAGEEQRTAEAAKPAADTGELRRGPEVETPETREGSSVAALRLKEPRAAETAPERSDVAGEGHQATEPKEPAPEAGEVRNGPEAPETEEKPLVASLTPEEPEAREKEPQRPASPAEDRQAAPKVAKGVDDPRRQIERFISSYCKAYEALSYERFMDHFTLDAMENDRTVKELKPVYRANFDQLEAVSYDIVVEHYTADNGMFEVRGDYALRWRFKGAGWRERRGPIFLVLVKGRENALRVDRLVYR